MSRTSLSSGAIFVLTGADGRTVAIERGADVFGRAPAPAIAARQWRSAGWRGRSHGAFAAQGFEAGGAATAPLRASAA